jgi:hypothetical protein
MLVTNKEDKGFISPTHKDWLQAGEDSAVTISEQGVMMPRWQGSLESEAGQLF